MNNKKWEKKRGKSLKFYAHFMAIYMKSVGFQHDYFLYNYCRSHDIHMNFELNN